ncbi:MAG: PDZ domain-containing protein, partial [Saprospiraceae bacterium]
QTGDVILQLDDAAVTAQPGLIAERNKHQPGDPFTLKVVRNGNEMTINARFKSCTEEEAAAYKQKGLDRIVINVISPEQYAFNANERRNPCAPFIGVLTGGETPQSGEGVLVTEVIDATPAQVAGLQTGDIILALDGTKVYDHKSLCRERDKHMAGDQFQLTVLRDGKKMKVNAQFKACDQPAKPAAAPQPEGIPAQPAAPANAISRLEMTSLSVFPNPTAGPVSVRFEAAAVPTTVRIIDVAGRTIYSKTINQFSGFFNEDIDLGNNRPGIFTLQIEQNGQILTEQIVLTNRA